MVRYHGNWCGPGWTAGQYKDASELTQDDRDVEAVDALDQACKEHDINLHDYPEHADVINKNFIKRASKLGIKGGVAAAAVYIGGPAPMGRKDETPGMIWQRKAHMEAQADSRITSELKRKAEEMEMKDDDGQGYAVDTLESDRPATRQRPNTEQMQIDMGGETRPTASTSMAVARSGGGGGAAGGNNQVSKETPISPYPSLPYGLQETHTCICPWTGYVSPIGMDYNNNVVLDLRLTQPHDIVATQTVDPPTGTALANGVWGRGLFNVKYNAKTTSTNLTVLDWVGYPSTLNAGPNTTERASWFKFYCKLYEFYTVLGCEYEIMMDNPHTSSGQDVAVAYDFNTYSDTAGATGNRTPSNAKLHQMKEWKHINWINVNSRSPDQGDNRKVLRGTYKPGQAKRNIQNDGDVKTWISTGAPSGDSPAAPSLKEFLTLYFYPHELLGPSFANCGLNIQIKMKYIVQFKDLRVQARYPLAGVTDITLTIDDDVVQVPAAA